MELIQSQRKAARSAFARALQELARAASKATRELAELLGDEQTAEIAVCAHVATLLEPELPLAARQWVQSQFCLSGGRQPAEGAAYFHDGPTALATAAHALRQLPSTDPDPLALFYERYLHALNGQARQRRGVFYTPPAIVRFMIRAVDQQLRDEFNLPDGLADASGFVRVLDPALGAGLFLTEMIRFLHERSPRSDWKRFIADLLPRLGGIEIAPAAAYIALVRIAATLAATGFDFTRDAYIQLTIGDALAAPIRPAWNIIIGNPPFSGISATKHAWLERLLHGQGPHGEARADYFAVAGAPLAEKKHWLHDDYVKFLRVAHEQIETTGAGIVALVTGHGYLDNISFRGLREKLTQTFPRITLLDLHGNAKRRERTPDGGRDENVFGIEQGVAIGLFRRPPGSLSSTIERIDLWGSRAEKLARLQSSSLAELLPIIQPCFARSPAACSIYDAGWPLDQVMPLNSTAPVTARDRFVVAHNVSELAERCANFCDLSILDDEIRRRYFTRTRSRKYAAGDTRGWSLHNARQRMCAGDWRTLVRPVLYRPFDWRLILWADWLIDWPRPAVTSQLLAEDNLTLITRRQAPSNQPWTFVWITDTLTLDGVIRSDNCGSESLFPLWIGAGDRRKANFAAEFMAAVEHATGSPFDPQAAFDYIYALLHAPAYRLRYGAQLSGGFPRVVLPRSSALCHDLAGLGARLRAAHLDRESRTTEVEFNCEAIESFHVGSHQICRKLRKDRSAEDATCLPLAQIEATLQIQSLIDAAIEHHGGYERAFVS